MLRLNGLVIWLRYLQFKKQRRNIPPIFPVVDNVFMDIYPYMFTYGGPQLFVLFVLFVVTPGVYRMLLKKRPTRARIISVLGIWMAAVIVAYGDVFIIAREAKRLCHQEAGIRVYRTVHAEGILGPVGIRDLLSYGIRFVESRTPGGKPTVRESFVNGEYKEERITSFNSEVEFTWEELRRSYAVTQVRDLLIERRSSSVLAEIVAFEFYPGWIDSRLLGFLGFSWMPPRCDDDYIPKQGQRWHHISEFIRRTINTR